MLPNQEAAQCVLWHHETWLRESVQKNQCIKYCSSVTTNNRYHYIDPYRDVNWCMDRNVLSIWFSTCYQASVHTANLLKPAAKTLVSFPTFWEQVYMSILYLAKKNTICNQRQSFRTIWEFLKPRLAIKPNLGCLPARSWWPYS